MYKNAQGVRKGLTVEKKKKKKIFQKLSQGYHKYVINLSKEIPKGLFLVLYSEAIIHAFQGDVQSA